MAAQVQFVRHNGKSALENIKEEKLYDLLVFASQQKDLDEIISSYYESKAK